MTGMPLLVPSAVGAAILAAAAAPASAHVSFDGREAVIGTTWKGVLRVMHGCKGSPTIRVRVQIPDGVVLVRPQPKTGWQLETVMQKYDKPIRDHGVTISEGVKEISWSGGRLPDGHFDEFAFIGQLTHALKPGTMLHFPVVQECEKGIERWIDLPDGKRGEDDGAPAPAVRLVPRR